MLLCLSAQVQEENMQQAEIVAVQAKQIEAIKSDLQDTQKLLSALQSKSCFVHTHASVSTANWVSSW